MSLISQFQKNIISIFTNTITVDGKSFISFFCHQARFDFECTPFIITMKDWSVECVVKSNYPKLIFLLITLSSVTVFQNKQRLIFLKPAAGFV